MTSHPIYNASISTAPHTQITVRTGDTSQTADLYSQAGLEMVGALWLKLAAEYRLMYEHTWLGAPVIQLPSDAMVMQELIWRLRPDAVVECGLAHGGSAILYASILELIGHGEVIGVDREIRAYNRVALRAHPLAHRIHLIEGDSAAEETFAAVRERVSAAARVLVVLDSNHGAAHVARELELYHRLVTPSSYLVVMDGAQAHVWDTPRGREEWRTDNPLAAVDPFLAAHPEFESDPYCTRAVVTSSPRGFLRRRGPAELARAFEHRDLTGRDAPRKEWAA